MASVSHAVMDSNTNRYLAADAAIAAKLDGPEWPTASPMERRRGELAIAAERKAWANDFLARQRAIVDAAEAAWKANTPALIQREAALGNPQRATAVKALAQGASPAELRALASALVQAGDAAGAYGLRQSLAGRELGEDVGDAGSVALRAGTEASVPKLRELVRCRSAWARSVGATTGMLDPAAVLTADEEARQIPLPDGSGARRGSDAEIAALVADD